MLSAVGHRRTIMPKDKLKEYDIATGQQMRSLLPNGRDFGVGPN